ncbi:MAG: hypothetical protein AAF483_14070 [Planctomycetota bacterium]
MNYLSHAYRFLDDPYFAAATGMPDWMSVIDRKNRARRQFALPVTEDPDPVVAAVARGCVQHHDDDRWFHMGDQFNLMCTHFAVELREVVGQGMGHQCSFVGHISIELLLDSVLCERDPTLLDRYYDNLESLDVEKLQAAANKICRKPVTLMTILIPRFIQERFLADYYDDELLLMRLNGVMKRVKLPPLPPGVARWLGKARTEVREHADTLLTPSVEQE